MKLPEIEIDSDLATLVEKHFPNMREELATAVRERFLELIADSAAQEKADSVKQRISTSKSLKHL